MLSVCCSRWVCLFCMNECMKKWDFQSNLVINLFFFSLLCNIILRMMNNSNKMFSLFLPNPRPPLLATTKKKEQKQNCLTDNWSIYSWMHGWCLSVTFFFFIMNSSLLRSIIGIYLFPPLPLNVCMYLFNIYIFILQTKLCLLWFFPNFSLNFSL